MYTYFVAFELSKYLLEKQSNDKEIEKLSTSIESFIDEIELNKTKLTNLQSNPLEKLTNNSDILNEISKISLEIRENKT
jgi:adenine C2-methylase RlmN of 23S rRNA A2503 and tRNA A37